MKTALLAGSFDPVTVGHMSVIRRASMLFDRVIVAVAQNEDKVCRFSTNERKEMLLLAILDIPNVEVMVSEGYTADFAASVGADVLIRGVRNADDLAFERRAADFNRDRTGIETLLFLTEPDLSDVNATAARDALKQGIVPESILPPEVIDYLHKKD